MPSTASPLMTLWGIVKYQLLMFFLDLGQAMTSGLTQI